MDNDLFEVKIYEALKEYYLECAWGEQAHDIADVNAKVFLEALHRAGLKIIPVDQAQTSEFLTDDQMLAKLYAIASPAVAAGIKVQGAAGPLPLTAIKNDLKLVPVRMWRKIIPVDQARTPDTMASRSNKEISQ